MTGRGGVQSQTVPFSLRIMLLLPAPAKARNALRKRLLLARRHRLEWIEEEGKDEDKIGASLPPSSPSPPSSSSSSSTTTHWTHAGEWEEEEEEEMKEGRGGADGFASLIY